MSTYKTLNIEGVVMNVTFEGSLTRAVMMDTRPDGTGLMATGNAKHHPDDVYRQDIGEVLAVSRAVQRFYHKMEKLAIAETLKTSHDYC